MASTRKATVELDVSGADASKQELDKVRTAAEDFGTSGKQSAQGMVDAFSNIEKADERLTQKISQGRTVTVRDAQTMIQQMTVLENEIKRGFGSLQNAPAAIQAAFAKSEATLERTKAKVRELTDAVSDQKGQLAEGGEKWTNLSDSVNKALGPLGSVQAKMGLVAAAFAEGWQIGQKLNTLFGTDMSEWNDATGALGAKIGSVIKAVSDNIVALANVLLALSSGSISEIRRSITDLKDTVANSMRIGVDAVSLWGNEWDAAHPKVKKASDAVDAHTSATEKNSTTLGAHTEVLKKATTAEELFAEAKSLTEARLKKLNEETEKLNKKIAETTEAEKKQEEALTKANNAFMDAEIGVINRTSDMGYFGRVVNESTKALELQNAAVAESTAKYGANDPFTLQAIERQKQLELSLGNSKSRYDQAKSDVDDYSKKQDQASAAVERAKENLAKLDTQLAESKTQLANLDVPLGSVADNVKKVADHAAKAATGTAALTNAQAQQGPAAQTLSQTLPLVADATEKLGNVNAGLITKTQQTTVEMQKLDAILVQIKSSMSAARAEGEALLSTITNLGSATAKTAGTGFGGPTPSAGVQPGNELGL